MAVQVQYLFRHLSIIYNDSVFRFFGRNDLMRLKADPSVSQRKVTADMITQMIVNPVSMARGISTSAKITCF